MSGENCAALPRSTGFKHSHTLIKPTEQLLSTETEAQRVRCDQLILHEERRKVDHSEWEGRGTHTHQLVMR